MAFRTAAGRAYRAGHSTRPTRALLLVLSCLLLFALPYAAPTATADAQILIRFSHVAAPETTKGRAVQRFRELAEQRSQGRVKVEVYAKSRLYRDHEEFEALRLGTVQLLAPSLSKLAELGVADFELFGLPFLFPDHAAFRKLSESALGASLLGQLRGQGITGLAYWANGYEVFSAHKPVRNVADLKGLRVRIQSSRLVRDELRAIGAVPVVAGLSDEARLVRAGQIDASEGVPSNLFTQRTHTLLPHVTVTNHRFLASAVLANETFWSGLPPDIRAMLEAALAEVTLYTQRVAAGDNERALRALAESGQGSVYRPNAQELEGFRRALSGSYLRVRSLVASVTWDGLCALLHCPRAAAP